MPPTQLGPYRIVRKIGRGGMGTVYEGVDDSTRQTAAIKLLAADMAGQADFRDRFKGEIETLRKLSHPNIVQIYGFGEEDQQIYYAMEYVSGSSLEEQIGRGRTFDWREVTQLGIAVARGLRHAHDRGVIHRDIKPGNLLLSDAGLLKISDFGIARLFGHSRLTSAGSVLGTAEFMSPEQAEGRAVDPRSDLYSLGGVMYVLLSRRPLYQARSFAEMIDKQRFETPESLRQLAPDIPAEFEQVVHRLLEKDPQRRFATAMVLERRLETLLDSFKLPQPDDGKPVTVEPAPIGPLAGSEPRPIDPFAVTMAATRRGNPAASEDPSAEPARTPNRFVLVQPGELDRRPAERPAGNWISPQTLALVLGLIALGALAWYSLQPPSADALYRRIERQVKGDSGGGMQQAEDDIRSFLNRFPDDSRSPELKDYALQIDLSRLEHRLDLDAKSVSQQSRLTPIQRCYVEALSAARNDLEAGIARFKALIDLYDPPPDASGDDAQCIELAKRRLAEFQKQSEALAHEQLKTVEEQLNRADLLRASDRERAERMYRAVIELYGTNAWAKEAVARAKTALEEKRKE